MENASLSTLITTELTMAIVDQDSGKGMIKKFKNSRLQAKYDAIAESCCTSSKRALLAAGEKGASKLAKYTKS